MKKVLLALILTALCTVGLIAQDSAPTNDSAANETANQSLQDVYIDGFEDAGVWKVSIPADHGVISSVQRSGVHKDFVDISKGLNAGQTVRKSFVLGLKAQFFGRTNTSISIEAIRPFPVPGVCQTISVWVVGRSYNHKLSVIVEDYFGSKMILPMRGTHNALNFSGWEQMTAYVPTLVPGKSGGLRQRDPHYLDRQGIKIVGFVIEPDMLETYGTFFTYFDDLRVNTDLYGLVKKDADGKEVPKGDADTDAEGNDMADNW